VSLNPVSFDGEAHTLVQIHAPNETGDCDYSGNAISLLPRMVDGVPYWSVLLRLDGGQVQSGGASHRMTQVFSEPMPIGAWADWVFNFSLSTRNEGYFHVWRNGELVASRVGVTNVNYIDSCGNPIPPEKRNHNGPHLGIYGPSCKEGRTPSPHYRELLIDELRTASGPDGFSLVDPACAR